MKTNRATALRFAVSLLLVGASMHAARVTESFDRDWRFLKADALGAQKTDFNDSQWRKLDVPHDWSIEGPFAETNKTSGAGAFLPSGVGWYRKQFSLPSHEEGRRVFIEFDGVMQNSDVWINGHHLGRRPSGYVSFSYDLTEHVQFGSDRTNVVAVRTDTSAQAASRWYSGAGIYRHVRLVVTDPVYIPRYGLFVCTKEADASKAVISIRPGVTNRSDAEAKITVQNIVFDPDGKKLRDVASNCTIESKVKLEVNLLIEKPQLWSPESPKLYRVVSRVLDNGQPLDEQTTWFGIRTAEFKSDTGFWLNGKNFKLYGVCLHHDGSAFGAAVPNSIWEQRLKALRELGCNAIRTAHNPPSPDFLDLCDRMGFLVMDEFFDCWTVRKNPYDYHLYFDEWSKRDAADTIRGDRNHPSVVLWSVGNEIKDTPKAELAKEILKGLVDVCHENDPTRPVTQALFRPNVSHDFDNGLADLLDVIGTNYRDNELLAAQREKPTRKIVGTEQHQDRATWLQLRDNPSHSGQFLWTGVDYLGESRRWPIVAAGSGLLDRTGAPKPMAFERQSWWSSKPMVYVARRIMNREQSSADGTFVQLDRRQVLFSDWTPEKLDLHEESVEVYSNCEEVELFLNNKSLGTKPINADASPRTWKVQFESGLLKAAARNKGKEVANHNLRTAGKATKIVLKPDRTRLAQTWDDVACVRAIVVDTDGVPAPNAGQRITFHVNGPGVVVAVDSADNSSHEPFQGTERQAYHGECIAFLRAAATTGNITLTASAPGLASGSAAVVAVAPAVPNP